MTLACLLAEPMSSGQRVHSILSSPSEMAPSHLTYGEELRRAAGRARLVLLLVSCSNCLFAPRFESRMCSCYVAYLSKPQNTHILALICPESPQHPACVYNEVYSRI